MPRPIARISVTIVALTVSLFVLKSFLSTAFFVLVSYPFYFLFIKLKFQDYYVFYITIKATRVNFTA